MTKAPFPDLMPMLAVSDVSASVEFYTKAFGMRLYSEPMKTPDGVAYHAELAHGEGVIMLGLERQSPERVSSPRTSLQPPPVTLYLYVDDLDDHYLRAKEGGAEVVRPPEQMFWGDRVYEAKCPQGYRWMFATHTGKYSAPPF